MRIYLTQIYSDSIQSRRTVYVSTSTTKIQKNFKNFFVEALFHPCPTECGKYSIMRDVDAQFHHNEREGGRVDPGEDEGA